jgi:hygromycin-B 4-O-kinase
VENEMSVNQTHIQQFLESHYGHHITDLTALGAGEWSQAFSFRLANADYVIRFGGHREDFEKDQRAAAFAPQTLGVPKVREIGEALGSYFAISERVYGELLDDLEAEGMRHLVPAVFALFDALRTIDISSTTGYGLWDASGNAPFASWKDYLLSAASDDPARRTHGWRDRLAHSPVGNKPFTVAYERLEQCVGAFEVERSMIHSDLLNRNVFTAEGKISAVIDWGCAMYADFLYDSAWFSYWSPWYSTMQGIDWEAEARKHFESIGWLVPRMQERLLCCKIHIGLDAQAYNAFMGRWDHLETNAKRTLQLCV